MANQITDSRTLVTSFDTVTDAVNLSGVASGTQDTEIFLQGSASVGFYVGSSLDGILYNAGSAQNWSNNVFYIWVNSGIVGLLDTKANGGFRIRFAGTNASDFFEVYVGGSDEWPNAISGGWTQFVVDIEVARTAAVGAGQVGGTPPPTTAIRYVGYAAVTVPMPRMTDNTWVDEIRRVDRSAASPAAVTIEGRNGGTTPWTWADVRAQLGVASGVVKDGPGGSYVLNGPVQFGAEDAEIHEFLDTSQVLLWDDQEFVADSYYALNARGGATGSTTVTAGIKDGTGNDATGSQGWIVQAAANGARWTADFNDPNVDAINIYGSTFIHAAALSMNSASVEAVSTQMIDCSSLLADGSVQLRNAVIAPNTLTGEPFASVQSVSTFVFCTFESAGTGHAIGLTGTLSTPQSSVGNLFTGYATNAGTAGDRALFNDLGGAVTVNVSGGGDVPSVRNGAGATTSVELTVSFQITGLRDGTEVRLYRVSDGVELAGEENVTSVPVEEPNGVFLYEYPYSTDIPIYVHIHNIEYVFIRLDGQTLTNQDQVIPVQQRFDRTYSA